MTSNNADMESVHIKRLDDLRSSNNASTQAVDGKKPTLLWIQVDDLDQILDSATYLKPSQELREMGWNVILTQAAPPDSEMTFEHGILRVPRRKVYLIGQIILHLEIIRWMLKRRDIDIVMFHEISAAWLLLVPLIYRLSGRRRPLFVMDFRTLFMGTGSRGLKDRLRALYYRYSHTLADTWVDGHLAITSHIAQAVGIRPDRLLGIWPSGVDPNLFQAAIGTRHWPIDDEPVHLVYIGSLYAERNLLTLCRAVITATNAGQNFTFTIVGSGDQKSELEELARTTNGVIIVRNSVLHEEVWKVLADTHVGVLPFPDELKFRVSSPIKLFEYMAAGMPILATRIICHTDVVANGRFAFWAKGYDEEGFVKALDQIWASRRGLAEMGEQAACAVKDWTWKASAEKLSFALHSLSDHHVKQRY